MNKKQTKQVWRRIFPQPCMHGKGYRMQTDERSMDPATCPDTKTCQYYGIHCDICVEVKEIEVKKEFALCEDCYSELEYQSGGGWSDFKFKKFFKIIR